MPGPADEQVLSARWLFPVSGPPLPGGTVTVRGDRIESVDPAGVRSPDTDFGNAAIIPGLVNAHTHLDLSGARGAVPPRSDFVGWLRDVIAHRRETKGGREFSCLKFRSMRKDAEKVKAELKALNRADGPQFYIENDPRLTRGRTAAEEAATLDQLAASGQGELRPLRRLLWRMMLFSDPPAHTRLRASTVIRLESSPPDKNVATGTSATMCADTESRMTSRRCSTSKGAGSCSTNCWTGSQ